MKQSAVEWLQEALSLTFEQEMKFEGLFQQAKEMEKQQQERSYSQEEVINLLYIRSMCQEHYESNAEVREWFNKFKKK